MWSLIRYRPTNNDEVQGLCRDNFLHLCFSVLSLFHMHKSCHLARNILQGVKGNGKPEMVSEWTSTHSSEGRATTPLVPAASTQLRHFNNITHINWSYGHTSEEEEVCRKEKRAAEKERRRDITSIATNFARWVPLSYRLFLLPFLRSYRFLSCSFALPTYFSCFNCFLVFLLSSLFFPRTWFVSCFFLRCYPLQLVPLELSSSLLFFPILQLSSLSFSVPIALCFCACYWLLVYSS